MAANDRQVGGEHYRAVAGEQHWDRQWRLYGPGYFVGCITKYVERYPEKNGLEDLHKAAHFLQKLIELESANTDKRKFHCVRCGEEVFAATAAAAEALHGTCSPGPAEDR